MTCRPGLARSAEAIRCGHRPRPEVLVLQVDQGAGARERLAVGVRDTPLAVRRERVAAQPGRVGPQHLDRVRATPAALVRHRLGQRAAGHRAHVVRAVVELADRAGQVQDAAAVPALAEGVLEVVHGRAAHLGLDVVPRRPRAVAVREVHHLRVAVVLRVVVAAVAQVDPARRTRRRGRGHPGAGSRPASGDGCQPGGSARRAAPGRRPRRSPGRTRRWLPRTAAAPWAGSARAGRRPAPLGCAARPSTSPTAEPGPSRQFVQVTAEVQEVDLVAGLGRVQLGAQPGEVAAPVHQRLRPGSRS